MASQSSTSAPPEHRCEWRHGCTRESAVGLDVGRAVRWLCGHHIDALAAAADANGRTLVEQARAADVFRRRRAAPRQKVSA